VPFPISRYSIYDSRFTVFNPCIPPLCLITLEKACFGTGTMQAVQVTTIGYFFKTK
jgi:hypothetical protein